MEPTNPTPTPEAPKPAAAPVDDAAIQARLAEAEARGAKSILAQLGIAERDTKKATEALKALQESQKSEADKLRERVSELEPKSKEAEAYRAEFAELAKTQMAALSDKQREAIIDLAGEDPRQQVKTIRTMKEKGLLVEAAPVADKTKPAVKAAPATTGKPVAAPAAAGGVGTVDPYAAWQSLKTVNPMRAARYYDSNHRAIDAARPKSA